MSDKKQGRPKEKELRVGKTATGRPLLTITGSRLTDADLDIGASIECETIRPGCLQIKKIIFNKEVNE